MQNNKAFSMIELSVIVMVIGIIIAGIIKGNNLYTKSKLRIAQRLTIESPVQTVPGLVFWLEPTLNESFLTSERKDNTSISIWNDIKDKTLYGPSYNLTQDASGDDQPKYISNAFGKGISGVRFDGTNDSIYNGNVEVNSNQITYFVVAKRISHANPDTSIFVGRNSSDTTDYNAPRSFNAFWESTGNKLEPMYNLTVTGNLTALTHPGNNVIYIASSIFDGTKNTSYLNGSGASPANASTNFTDMRITIGARDNETWSASNPVFSGWWNGDVAEIIFYNRALNSKERKVIEKYLSQKYGVAISH